MDRTNDNLPPLYPRGFEHDACGIAFLARLDGIGSHELVETAIAALINLEHRGAKGAEPDTGDGAGILIQNPHRYWKKILPVLPDAGAYATGIAFVEGNTSPAMSKLEMLCREEGLELLALRDVPRDDSVIGETARRAQPKMIQPFIASVSGERGLSLERKVWILRRRAENEIPGLYFPSLSTRTFVFKGMLSAPQVSKYFLDLVEPEVESAVALVHSRFSTNTFPSWELAHPFRMIAHNGEINTIRGNRNWMRARESLLSHPELGKDIERIFPIARYDESDSASFDAVFELLTMTGRSLPHAIMMMIPEAWENDQEMDPAVRDFYRFHASLMEPWDGPAAVVFTDGTLVGAVLDRNGFRPARYWVTEDGLVIMASEVGVVEVAPEKVVKKGRLEPGRILLVDTAKGEILDDDAVKRELAASAPWGKWLKEQQESIDSLPPRYMLVPQHGSIVTRQELFGYTEEEIRLIIKPMAVTGQEPIGSMGSDTPPPPRTERPIPIFNYFVQQFAQVTNPPLDAIREELITSPGGTIGPEGNLLAPDERSVRQIYLPNPIIDNDELAKLVYINEDGRYPDLRSCVIDVLFPAAEREKGLREAIERIRGEAENAIKDGAAVIILSDRHAGKELAPIPSLLAVSAVHSHLVRSKLRTRAGLVVECGDAREVHHFATLLAFGAAAVNPYLAFDTIVDAMREGLITELTPRKAIRNYVKAATKGVIKVMSKMGISTVASYTGSQVFEAIGLSNDVIDEYFPGTPSPIGGVGLDAIADASCRHHRRAFFDRPSELVNRELEVGGDYQWRRDGEYHLFNPETVFLLQHSTRTKRFDIFRRYSNLVNDAQKRTATLRGLLEFETGVRKPVPLEEVEPASEIMKRFSTGAMSYGSISKEAHETLAIAMNNIGGRSNTGEGGEDEERFSIGPDGLDRRSRIKQVASGRFGVTSAYLVSADDIQIKMAQGAKPGEGGQLPGEKVYPWIAKTRHSTPGVGLISPPPHHDIYSIEDLAQLIYDLKAANPSARVHVKLVSEVGVGTIAAGVAKAHADVILISGGDGGTGAAPLTSIKHAGSPWEIGLAETNQTLLANGLRDRVVVQVDGQLKTGRDVVVAALLGAEEFGFASAPLVVSGCIMMRVCHLDTCPVGIATQNPELRAKYSGKPEFVETFFEYIAEEVRQYLAELGFRSIEEAIGHSELLKPADHPLAAKLELGKIVQPVEPWPGQERHWNRPQEDILAGSLNHKLIDLSQPALLDAHPVSISLPVSNTDRAVGTTLGYEVTKRYGSKGLPSDTIAISLTGSAGQSLGAFMPSGITIELVGDANDYVGKGLSGGKLIVRPPAQASYRPEETIVIGNVALYGATEGELYVRGLAGERFAVRNSGARAVVEGVGDHGCEYMTGGAVVILGDIGRNFAAGMSGGLAFIFDPGPQTLERINQEMVDIDPVDDEQMKLVADMLERHHRYTGSATAAKITSDPDKYLPRFVCVFPRDFKRVILQSQAAKRQGARERLIVSERG
jgi:glutamate synthase (NADPH/NADH) large chain